MDHLKGVFNGVKTILVIDWPSKEVPEALALAGFDVVVRGGPGPEDYSAYEVKEGQIVTRHVGRPPEHADLIYSYRSLGEITGIVATAKALHARTIWTQSGLTPDGKRDPRGCWVPQEELQRARDLVQSAGLNHVSEWYIAEYVREFRVARNG
jgi:predicted CoA-binding protein